jgi:SSS family solute:Na+ symporter
MPPQNELSLHSIDFAIIVAYLATLVGIGVYHARRQKDLQEFLLAGQQIRWLALGLSLMAALNSGLDYITQPGAMIKFGAVVLAGSLSWILLCPYVFYVTLPMYRRLGVTSAYEYLERRFDIRVRILTAGIFVLWRMGWMATALYVPALTISTATGGQISVSALVITLGVVITFYTMIGGIRAVIWNDVIQCCIMFAGLAVTVWLCIIKTEGGVSTIVDQFSQVGQEAQRQPPAGAPAGALSFFYIPMTVVGFVLSYLVSRLTAYTSDQVMVQRFQTSRSMSDAKRGFILTAISDTLWMLALGFVGLALFAYFKANYGELPAWVMDDPDNAFPRFMAQVFPAGLAGLVIAAILAASVSSIDSAVNSVTTVLTVDFAERLFLRRAASPPDAQHERGLVKLSRLITVAVGLVGIVLGLNVGRLGTLLEINNKVIVSFTGPILGIFLLGMFTRRATSTAVVIGGAAGGLVTMFVAFQREIYALANGWFQTDLSTTAVISFLWPATFGLMTTLILGYALSLPRRSSAKSGETTWTWRNIMQESLPSSDR